MIELKEFVSETLVQITQGVKDAQGKVKRLGAEINPPELNHANRTRVLPRTVEFDVAVTTIAKGNKKAGVGVFVSAISVGVQEQSDKEDNTVSRIKFDVRVRLPSERDKSK